MVPPSRYLGQSGSRHVRLATGRTTFRSTFAERPVMPLCEAERPVRAGGRSTRLPFGGGKPFVIGRR